MGLMKKVDIEIKNSPALGYLHHELKDLRTQVRGLQIIAKELLTAVDLKHLDETKKNEIMTEQAIRDQRIIDGDEGNII